MTDIIIPPALADLQRTASAAFEAIGAYEDEVGKPSLEWSDEERARLGVLWADARAAADALQRAVAATGLETDSYTFRRALHEAARE
jgi:hypothetical protein